MYTAPRNCPVCDSELFITRLYCPECDTTVEGRFTFGGLGNLSPEQLAFVETFVACEGKINRVQKVLGIAYPTVRKRLEEVIVTMGYEVGDDEEEDDNDHDELRRQVLDDLEAGRISSEDALSILRK